MDSLGAGRVLAERSAAAGCSLAPSPRAAGAAAPKLVATLFEVMV
jgi:hypothetical protein